MFTIFSREQNIFIMDLLFILLGKSSCRVQFVCSNAILNTVTSCSTCCACIGPQAEIFEVLKLF